MIGVIVSVSTKGKEMKRVVIRWQDRLDDLYFIAGDTGGTADECDYEWLTEWKPKKHSKGDDVEVEPIPDDEWREFVEYADSSEDEE